MKKALIVIFFAAFLIRFIGVYPGYNNYHSDEPILYGTAVDMIRNGNLDPQRYDYPGVSIYINYIAYRTIFIPIGWMSYYFHHISSIFDGTVHIPIAPLEARSILQTYIFGNREINVLTWGRTVAAFFSFGSVLLLYLLAKRIFNKEVAIVATLFIAFNFRQILNSHVNLPDIYNSFFLLLSFLATFNLWKTQNKKNYLIAGICAGLSFSTKYQFFSFLPIVLVQIYNSFDEGSFKFRKLFDLRILLSALAAVLIFFATNPYFLPNLETAIGWIQGVSIKYGTGVKKINLYPFIYYYRYDLGPFESIFVLIGFLIGLLKYTKKTLFFLAVLLPFFFTLNYYTSGGFYVRNYITVTPIILIFASLSFFEIYEFFSKKLKLKFVKILAPFILCVFLYVPAKNSLINSYYDTKKYNYNVLSDWMFENIPSGTVIAANAFDPPTGSPEVVKTEFELSGSYSLAEHKDDGAKYALLNADWAGNNFYIWMNFGFKDLKYFWNKPYEIMRNTFFGIASEELFRWQVFSVTKPWQAPDADLVMALIPEWPKTSFHVLKTFNFDDSEGWRVEGNFENLNMPIFFDNNFGHKKKGSITLSPTGARFATIRVASEPIKIIPGHMYNISGYLKTNEKLDSKKRDGFMRIDFYSDINEQEKNRLISSVTSRIFGSTDWILKNITERAPDTAKYMVVSLQASNTNGPTFWIDDIKIDESDRVLLDIAASNPYIKKEIDLNVLYPNSHGNL